MPATTAGAPFTPDGRTAVAVAITRPTEPRPLRPRRARPPQPPRGRGEVEVPVGVAELGVRRGNARRLQQQPAARLREGAGGGHGRRPGPPVEADAGAAADLRVLQLGTDERGAQLRGRQPVTT